MTRLIVLIACFALGACENYPRDASGTTDRIEAIHLLRVGVVSGTEHPQLAAPLLARLAQRLDAEIRYSHGPTERLLRKLEGGELDLVVGPFARASPLSREVSFSDAVGFLEPKDTKEPTLRIARRNGENRLILMTDRMAKS